MAGYVSAAAALALTSREDPFPSVELEALSAGTPVVVFERSGEFPICWWITNWGAVVPFADGAAMLEAILAIEPDEAAVAARSALIAERFDWDGYVGRLVELAKVIPTA